MGDNGRLPRLRVEVVWDDIRAVDADVHVVGHYQGVLPQHAERMLDEAVSGATPAAAAAPEHLVITELTRRGALRGALCDLAFIPWGRNRVVLVAGMGTPGSFRVKELSKLTAAVASTVGHLVDRPTLATVLIGAGAGNLGVAQCVDSVLDGLRDGFEADPSLRLQCVRIVEYALDRALEIHERIATMAGKGERGVAIDVQPLVEGVGGTIPSHFRFSMLLAAVARTSGLPATSPTREIFSELIKDLASRGEAEIVELQNDLAGELRKHQELRRLALRSFPIAQAPDRADRREVPTRLVFCFEGAHVRSSAITDTVTVTQRDVPISPGLLQEIASRLSNPDEAKSAKTDSVHRLGRHAYTLLVHPDLEERFRSECTRILEVDQPMAAVPWEMLVPADGERPLSVAGPVARQLRTSYSPRAEDARQRTVKRALVIGDPADGAAQLEDARKEARAVYDILDAHGIQTVLRIGPAMTLNPPEPPAEPAGFFDTLVLLLQEEFDLVHFCGHAIYVADQPDFIGWVFADQEILAAKYLQQMRRPPLLVFANACNSANLTGQIVQAATGRTPQEAGRRDTAMAAVGLADEFFRRGIRDYIGTGATVGSVPAAEFATELYTALFADHEPLGEAVRRARGKLYAKRAEYGAVWGLYQHYGDPLRVVG